MARSSYMPHKQADQVVWANRFVAAVQPNAAAYGVPAAMMAAFVDANDALQVAWVAASDPATRTRGSVATKSNCLKAMKSVARNLVSLIQGTPNVTDQMKIDAGVSVRKTNPTPKPVPTDSPFVSITAVAGRTVKFELRQSRTKRGKPTAVASATVFTAVGPTPPATMDEWRYAMITTLTTGEVSFGSSTTGDTVWITAFWSNFRGESGPSGTPASVNLPAGGVLPSAKTESSMRIAKAA